MSRRSPKATLWVEGGGMVTRCNDPEVARPLLVDAWLDEYGLIEVNSEEDVAELFPIDKAQVQRGRVEPRDPDMNDGYSWIWRPLPADRSGRGITTAVVWGENR